VKESTYKAAVWRINQIITNLYNDNRFLLEGDFLSEEEKNYIKRISPDMPEVIAFGAIYQLSRFLFNYYHKKVIILLDEYGTPMQEAYMNGYWGEIVSFIRNMFNAAFKTNPYLERSVMTGITRVSKESIFSDLNKLEVVTATSERYGDSFGFTAEAALRQIEEKQYGVALAAKDIPEGRIRKYGFAFCGKKVLIRESM